VQAMWETDSPLKQIPHFEPEVIKRCTDAGVVSVYDIMELEDDRRNELLGMDRRQMADVAKFVNAYPNIEVSHELEDPDDLKADAPIVVSVTLDREVDEDEGEDTQVVVAPFYPVKKMVTWWLVIGEPSTRQLLSIKKATVHRSLSQKLEFTLPKGEHKLKLYLICDSYNGADQDFDLEVSVAEGEDSDEDEDEDMDDE